MKHLKFVLLFMVLTVHVFYSQNRMYALRTIAFYNVENLFDTIDDAQTIDEDFTPDGKYRYRFKDYRKKITHIAKVIQNIGNTGLPPVLVGLAEIENAGVLSDLTTKTGLSAWDFRYIHYDSPDRRGIDVALLYREACFSPLDTQHIEVRIWDETGQRIYTRDILWVYGILNDEEIHVIVVHWPSRRGGKNKSRFKREKAAFEVAQLVEHIKTEYQSPKIIIMGDFNDNPTDKSIRKGLNSSGKRTDTLTVFYNPMLRMFKKGLGTLAHRDRMFLFDQILISRNFLFESDTSSSWNYLKAGIFNPDYLISPEGKYKGYPYRSFGFQGFTGGYSDHYPVFIQIVKIAK